MLHGIILPTRIKTHAHAQEERQALLHEGSGSAAVNAFVEIVFDNSDQRFLSDSSAGSSDEVVLRRTIGLKKDEFFLQRNVCTRRTHNSTTKSSRNHSSLFSLYCFSHTIPLPSIF